MRALVVHPGVGFSVEDVWRGWCRGLEACGVEVQTFRLDHRLRFFGSQGWDDNELVCRRASNGILETAFRWWPHLVVVICGTFTPPDVLDVMRARGMTVVVVHTESPYEDDRQIQLAPHATINLLNDPACIDSWRDVNPSTFYMPHAYDPAVHFPPVDPLGREGVVFVGCDWPSRVAFLEQIDWTGIPFELAGAWEKLAADSPLRPYVLADQGYDNDRTAALYRHAEIGFNLYRGESHEFLDVGWAIGPREVEMAACGLFFLRQARMESDELWPFLPTFETPAELEALIRHWLPRPRERAELAHRARTAILDRTFEANARRLLGFLG